MTSTKTISLDFGVPDVVATVIFEDEPPREPVGCPMCSEAAVSELAFITMCARCQDSASDCAACTPPAVTLGEVPAPPEDPGDRARDWYLADEDAAADVTADGRGGDLAAPAPSDTRQSIDPRGDNDAQSPRRH